MSTPPLAALALAALVIGCRADQPPRSRPPPGPPTHAVTIHEPARLTGVETGERDVLGRPVRAACQTCHSLRGPDALPHTMAELDEFHQGLTLRHGDLGCASCHVVGDQRSLRRADGQMLDARDAIALCRQCHGPQGRDYDHGAHGGMTGAWDLSSGGRVRNHCIDCHDPHAPQFVPTQPAPPPGVRRVGATSRRP